MIATTSTSPGRTPFGDRAGERAALGADAERVRGVLDVDAGDDATVAQKRGRADVEVRVGRVGVRRRGLRELEQLLVGHASTWKRIIVTSVPITAPSTTSRGRVDAGLDPGLGDEQRHDQRDEGDDDALVLATMKAIAVKPPNASAAWPEGSPPESGVPRPVSALLGDHDQDDEDQRDERQVARRLAQALDEPRARRRRAGRRRRGNR